MMPRRDNANPSSSGQANSAAAPSPQNNGFTQVVDDDLPF